jgi:hypothetical protein
MAQTQLQLATSAPQIHNLYEAFRRMYEAIGTKDIDTLLKPDDTIHPRPKDPASENADAIDGKTLTAFAGQQHDAHIVVHQMQILGATVEQNPLAGAILTKHILQHIRIKAEEMAEAEFFKQYGVDAKNKMSDIQREAQVAVFVAQNMAEVRQLYQQMSGASEPDPLIELKEQELQLRSQDSERKGQEAQAKLSLQQADQQQDAALAQQKIASSEQIAAEKAAIARARLQQTERQAQNATFQKQ